MSTTETPGTEFSSDSAAAPEEHAPPGIGPYALAWRRLRRNKTALAFGGLFLLVVVMCLLAPVYAKHVAHTTPTANHLTDQIKIGVQGVNLLNEVTKTSQAYTGDPDKLRQLDELIKGLGLEG